MNDKQRKRKNICHIREKLIKLQFLHVILSSLFTSILSMLSLAELGFGGALVYSMYKPIAENDTKSICALMNLYKKVYMVIGTIILAVGIIIMPFVPKMINGSMPC